MSTLARHHPESLRSAGEQGEGPAPPLQRVSQTGQLTHRVRECYTFEFVKRYWCYIMSNKSQRLYVGFTDNIVGRTIEHKEKLFPNSFTAQYVFDMLVYYEPHTSVIRAKMREKEIKGWREKKLKLILVQNPDWADLSLEWQENPGWNLLPEAQYRLERKVPRG